MNTVCAVQVSDVMDSESWSFRLTILFYFLSPGLMLVMAAEANHRVSFEMIL